VSVLGIRQKHITPLVKKLLDSHNVKVGIVQCIGNDILGQRMQHRLGAIQRDVHSTEYRNVNRAIDGWVEVEAVDGQQILKQPGIGMDQRPNEKGHAAIKLNAPTAAGVDVDIGTFDDVAEDIHQTQVKGNGWI